MLEQQAVHSPRNGAPAGVILEILTILTKHRKFIARFVLLATLGAGVAAFVLPKWYKSTASVFPAEKADLLGGLEGISSLAKSFVPGKALSALGGNNDIDRYMAILKSGAVLGAVIDKFDLVHVYDITTYPKEKTVKELLSNTIFNVEDEGYLTVTVFDKDPQRAADMANYFVEMLNKTNSELLVQNARGNRTFIEERYKKNLADLAAAEDSLKAFQQKYGVVAMPEQTEATIKTTSELAGQLALKEVQMGVLLRTQSPDNPAVEQQRIEIDELRKKMNQMSSGAGIPDGEMKVLVPFSRVPELGSQYIRRYRDVEIQYKILQFITPLYEQAKVEEHRETPSVLVLDRAGPAERKAKPKISLYMLMGFVISLVLSLLVVFAIEAAAKVRGTNPERFNHVLEEAKSDWFGIRLRRNWGGRRG